MSKLSAMVFGVLMILSFQNCSQNFGLGQNGSSSSNKLAVDAPPNSDGSQTPPAGGGQTDGQTGNQTGNHSGNNDPDMDCHQSDETYRSACQELDVDRDRLMMLGDNVNMSSINGNLLFKANSLGALSSLYGNVRILGLKPDSSINEIKDSFGNLIVCGMDIKKLTNHSGNVIVVDGDVGDISGLKGNLRIVGGKLNGSVVNVTGNILAK